MNFDYDNGMRNLKHGRPVVVALALALLAGALGGCDWFGSEPERRARGFIETLTREPDNLEALRGYTMRAPGVDPLAFTTEAPMHVALEYLRAKQRSGESLDFSAFETARPNQDSRRVAVRVRIGAARPATDEVMFVVELEHEPGGEWLVSNASVMP